MKWFANIWNGALKAAPLRLWAMMAGGPVMLACALWLITIVKDSHWPDRLRGKQLDFLGWGMMAFILINAIIIVALAAVRVSGRGPGGVGFEINADDDKDSPK